MNLFLVAFGIKISVFWFAVSVFALCLAGVVFALAIKRKKCKKNLLKLTVMMYTLGVLALTLLPLGRIIDGSLTLIKALEGFNFTLRYGGVKDAVVNLFLLMPLGLYYGYIKKRHLLICPLILSVIIEVTQMFIISRTADVNDVILNAAGAAAGYLIVEASRRIIKKEFIRLCSLI